MPTAPLSNTIYLSVAAPNAREVFLAGTFNAWEPQSLRMEKDAQGLWGRTLDLAPGKYEYKFIVDGQWCCEAGCEKSHAACPQCVPNTLGTMNRVLEVH